MTFRSPICSGFCCPALWTCGRFYWTNMDHNCLCMWYPANFTICAQFTPCITLTASCKSLITVFYKETLFWCICLDIQTFPQLKHDSNHVFVYMRINIFWKYTLPTKSKTIHCLLVRKTIKVAIYLIQSNLLCTLHFIKEHFMMLTINTICRSCLYTEYLVCDIYKLVVIKCYNQPITLIHKL